MDSSTSKHQVALEIRQACREQGFFYITGHGIDRKLQLDLEHLSWLFFEQPESIKMQISMDRGGKAWRGYFPLEGELTDGKPDRKEGIYFGEELPDDHPMVLSGTPLHGKNLFPDIHGFDEVVLIYLEGLKQLGRNLMQGIALSLELPEDYFEQRLMRNPITLFRIFHYPMASSATSQWGVGEHTDYGMLTILRQDDVGGLQVYAKNKWIEAPYLEDSLICNIGDMLDLMTGGYYRSTPHRVLNTSNSGRLSFPYFYDLDFNSKPKPTDLKHLGHRKALSFDRWDHSDLHDFSGTYGDYLLTKVSKVFPYLGDNLV